MLLPNVTVEFFLSSHHHKIRNYLARAEDTFRHVQTVALVAYVACGSCSIVVERLVDTGSRLERSFLGPTILLTKHFIVYFIDA